MQLFIKVQELVDLCGSQGLPQILFRNKQKFNHVFPAGQFFYFVGRQGLLPGRLYFFPGGCRLGHSRRQSFGRWSRIRPGRRSFSSAREGTQPEFF